MECKVRLGSFSPKFLAANNSMFSTALPTSCIKQFFQPCKTPQLGVFRQISSQISLSSSLSWRQILVRSQYKRIGCINSRSSIAETEELAVASEGQNEEDDVDGNGSWISEDVKVEDFGEVSRIIGSRVVDRKTEYLIEWKDDHPDSWEPADNIAKDVVAEYVTPWWQAARKADEKILKELLEEEGRDVNAIDENGRTALLFTAGLGSEKCVRLLVESGADLHWQDDEGFTALHIAAGYVHSTIVKALLELGADPDIEDSKGRSVPGLAHELLEKTPRTNPIHFARRIAMDQIVKLLDEAMYEAAEVQQILSKRILEDGNVEYLVKWSDDSEVSWLPVNDIAEDLVQDYEAGLEYGIVEKILEERSQDGRVEYFVKWTDNEQHTWEPPENLSPDVIAEFKSVNRKG